MLPLTHRDWSSAVSFVTGTCKGLAEQDWSGLAGHGRTLVVYMGVTVAKAIADKLMADGFDPGIACAVLERGTLPGSRAMRTLLADLGDMVEVVLLSDAEDRMRALAKRAEAVS
jgi:uroporphyrin-III C-methyltransferase